MLQSMGLQRVRHKLVTKPTDWPLDSFPFSIGYFLSFEEALISGKGYLFTQGLSVGGGG